VCIISGITLVDAEGGVVDMEAWSYTKRHITVRTIVLMLSADSLASRTRLHIGHSLVGFAFFCVVFAQESVLLIAEVEMVIPRMSFLWCGYLQRMFLCRYSVLHRVYFVEEFFPPVLQ
jgi:hypothetical protein